MTRPEVFSYSETRAFLKDLKIHLETALPTKATYEALAGELHLTSRTQARKIFKGDLSIPKKSILAMEKAFGLNKEEILYLELLRQFEQSKDPEQSIGLYKKVLQIQKAKIQTKDHTLTEDQLQLLDKWFYIHILFYFDLVGSRSEPRDIYLAFKGQISLDEVNEGLKVLQKIGLVKVQKDGQYVKTASHVSLLDHLPRAVVKKFHSMMIERSLKSVYEIPFEQRFLMASTIPVHTSALPIIQQRIADFVSQLDKEFSRPNADSLYQLNLQFFHVASKRSEENGN